MKNWFVNHRTHEPDMNCIFGDTQDLSHQDMVVETILTVEKYLLHAAPCLENILNRIHFFFFFKSSTMVKENGLCLLTPGHKPNGTNFMSFIGYNFMAITE